MLEVIVATLNVHGRADRWLARRHLLAAQIVDAQPDLVALQEVSLPIRQGHWLRNQVNFRLSGSARGPYRLVYQRRRHLVAGYLQGVAVLSKWPIIYQDSLALGHGGCVALRVNVRLSTHQTLDFVTTQLVHAPYAREAREEQALKLLGWLSSLRRVPLQVVAGDFNEGPQGLAIHKMRQAFRSAYAAANGREPLATYPTALRGGVAEPSACLDYIFVSRAVRRVTAARLFGVKPDAADETLYPSDHVGILATLGV